MADISSRVQPTNATARAAQSDVEAITPETPGLVMFAGVMLFLMGGFQLTWAIVEFANAAWISAATYGTFDGRLWLWAILDVAFAIIAFAVGFDVLIGGRFGQIAGLIIAGISAMRWFFYIPAAPWIALVMIAVNVLIIYALVAHSDYFGAKNY